MLLQTTRLFRSNVRQQTVLKRHYTLSMSLRTATYASPSDVFVLDFDGVIVDSEPEVSRSALMAAKEYWPQEFENLKPESDDKLRRNLRTVRPVLVRGYESMVMARALLEDPNCVDAILADWPAVLDAKLHQFKSTSADLDAFFEKKRNHWMTTDTDGWMDEHVVYPGLKDLLAACPFPFYIASSKAAHRVAALCERLLGLQLPVDSPRLFASLLPPEEKKVEALLSIASRPLVAQAGATLHFVDDRLDTLTAVAANPTLKNVRLYLADWGYNTAAERAAAKAHARIKVLSLASFIELLKFGLIMEVDDGCEPTAAEVEAGVHTRKVPDDE